MIRPLAACLVAALLMGCASTNDTPESPPPSNAPSTPATVMPDEPAAPDSIVTGVGTVQYVALEGGFYGIVNRETERRYVPESLPETYQIDGLAVRFELLLKPGQPSFRMWGIPAEIISMEKAPQKAPE